MRRKSAKLREVLSFECSRCGEIHNGTKPGPGWRIDPPLCSSCDDLAFLADLTGASAPRKAA